MEGDALVKQNIVWVLMLHSMIKCLLYAAYYLHHENRWTWALNISNTISVPLDSFSLNKEIGWFSLKPLWSGLFSIKQDSKLKSKLNTQIEFYSDIKTMLHELWRIYTEIVWKIFIFSQIIKYRFWDDRKSFWY